MSIICIWLKRRCCSVDISTCVQSSMFGNQPKYVCRSMYVLDVKDLLLRALREAHMVIATINFHCRRTWSRFAMQTWLNYSSHSAKLLHYCSNWNTSRDLPHSAAIVSFIESVLALSESMSDDQARLASKVSRREISVLERRFSRSTYATITFFHLQHLCSFPASTVPYILVGCKMICNFM